MAREKGVRIGGRKTGTPNESTTNHRASIQKWVDELEKTMPSDLKELSPEMRVSTYLKLMSFLCPKPVEKVEDDSVNQTRANINFVLENAGVIITKKKKK
jgi:hypothetical protein